MRRPWRDVLGELDAHDPVPAGEMPLDPGIRRHVLILRAEGIETDQSCQGGPGHACPEPMVRFHGNAYEGHKAFAIAMTYGLPVLDVRRVYSVVNGELQGPLWEMTFRTADPEATSREALAVVAERETSGA
jgi:hypothetical protein